MTVTLAAQTRPLREVAAGQFSAEVDPMDADEWADPDESGFTIEMAVDGERAVVHGRVLWRHAFLPHPTRR